MRKSMDLITRYRNIEKPRVVGLMSGTSADAIDAALVEIDTRAEKVKLLKFASTPLPDEVKAYLQDVFANMGTPREISMLSWLLGDLFAETALKVMDDGADLIASHGQTISHLPDGEMFLGRKVRCTQQIGEGAAIAAKTGCLTVCDFRPQDLAAGGQGAPLVPIGDNLLFADYDYCLNIGGFSNISFRRGEERIAFDISPVNYVINRYARSIGLEMDRDGLLAKEGTVDQALLDRLNALEYYRQPYPKSLSREWVEAVVFPLLEQCGLPLKDLLRSYYEHCACQFARVVTPGKTVLVTGGGAYNQFLIDRMRELSACRLVIPDAEIVEYKEALIFAFLGVLYMLDRPSCLRSATGARQDNIGGMLFKV